jgi:hypothetical protein
VWRAIGKSKFLVQARTLPKTVLVAVTLVVVVLGLFLFPADFDLHAKGTLEPELRRDVYADADGTVDKLGPDADDKNKPIEHGSRVEEKQLLVQLSNPKLELQQADIKGQAVIEREHLEALEHERATRGTMMKPDELARLMGELAQSKEKLSSLEHQDEVFQAQIDALTVKSPIGGKVVTWDLKNRLEKRPVHRGDSLLRVANPDGDWEVELHMTDDRMGHIARQLNQLRDTSDPHLQVTYILATQPGAQHKGTVKEISLVANPEKEEGNIVLIRIKINKDDINQNDRLAGAAVSGKVHCGRRSLGYVWFHDLFAFIQTKIFFRFF